MTQTVVFIHTIPQLLAVFNREAAARMPDVRVLHVLDEPMLERVRQRGGLADEDSARLATHVAEAAAVGAEAVLVTCSTISPCVDDVRLHAAIPVLKIDEAMIEAAVRFANRIGVLATNRTTLQPTRSLLEREAERAGKPVEIEMLVVEHALPALLSGDGETHDRLVRPAIAELARRNDVVVLAQASIARVLDTLAETDRPVPILSSPHLALAALRDLIQRREER